MSIHGFAAVSVHSKWTGGHVVHRITLGDVTGAAGVSMKQVTNQQQCWVIYLVRARVVAPLYDFRALGAR
jgi:hypothetical protein